MDILSAVIFFGCLQTVSTISHHHWKWMGCLTAIAGGCLCYLIHPWVAGINFARLNEALATPEASSLLATLLFVEASAKVLERFHEPGNALEGAHIWFRVQRRMLDILCGLIRYMPPFSLLFSLFYAQLYAFYASENIPFARLSLMIAAGFALIIAAGSLAMRLWVSNEERRLVEYRLLFLQLILALSLPVAGRWGASVPLFHEEGLYLRFAELAGIILAVALMGYMTQRRLFKKTISQP